MPKGAEMKANEVCWNGMGPRERSLRLITNKLHSSTNQLNSLLFFLSFWEEKKKSWLLIKVERREEKKNQKQLRQHNHQMRPKLKGQHLIGWVVGLPRSGAAWCAACSINQSIPFLCFIDFINCRKEKKFKLIDFHFALYELLCWIGIVGWVCWCSLLWAEPLALLAPITRQFTPSTSTNSSNSTRQLHWIQFDFTNSIKFLQITLPAALPVSSSFSSINSFHSQRKELKKKRELNGLPLLYWPLLLAAHPTQRQLISLIPFITFIPLFNQIDCCLRYHRGSWCQYNNYCYNNMFMLVFLRGDVTS